MPAERWLFTLALELRVHTAPVPTSPTNHRNPAAQAAGRKETPMLEATRYSDPELYAIVSDEFNRQQDNLEMIASEGTVPHEVLELNGCVFTNKTTEDAPGRRFQAGSKEADRLENLAIARAKEVFGAEHANVQPYSGTMANYAVFAAVLQPGDTVLSMSPQQGGHLTHGSPDNFLSKVYSFVQYGVNRETEHIDYGQVEELAMRHKPRLIVAGASAYPRLIDFAAMRKIADSCGALLLADIAHTAGLVAAKVIPSPVPYSDFVSSSTAKTFCGSRGGFVLCKAEQAAILDRGVFPGTLSAIHLPAIAANAFCMRYVATNAFRMIMERVLRNAATLASALEERGFRLVSGGTDTHLLLVDLRPKGISGKVFQHALEIAGITVNRNLIPFDPAKASETSGVRVGLTRISQRGIEEKKMIKIADIMNSVAENHDNSQVLDICREKVRELLAEYPLYPVEHSTPKAHALPNVLPLQRESA